MLLLLNCQFSSWWLQKIFKEKLPSFYLDFEKMEKKNPGLLDNIQYRVCEAAVHYHNEVQGMTKIWYITVLSLSIIQSSSKETQNYFKKTAKKSKTDYKFSPKTQKETKKCLQTTTQCTKWLANNKDTKFIKVKAKPLQREWPQTTNATTTPTAWLVVWDLRSLCVSLSLRVYIGQDLLQVCAKGS